MRAKLLGHNRGGMKRFVQPVRYFTRIEAIWPFWQRILWYFTRIVNLCSVFEAYAYIHPVRYVSNGNPPAPFGHGAGDKVEPTKREPWAPALSGIEK